MFGVKWPDQYPGRAMRVLVNNKDDVNQNSILIEFHVKKTFHRKKRLLKYTGKHAHTLNQIIQIITINHIETFTLIEQTYLHFFIEIELLDSTN